MGYRHYVGFIPKNKLEEIKQMNKDDFIKLINTYDDDEFGSLFTCYDLSKASLGYILHCVGKLYYSNTQEIYDTLYNYKLEDFPHFQNTDCEFFILKPNNTFFKDMAKAYWNCYLNYLKETDIKSIGSYEKNRTKFDSFEYMFEKGADNFMLSRSDEFSFMTYNWLHLHKTFDYENNVIYISAW